MVSQLNGVGQGLVCLLVGLAAPAPETVPTEDLAEALDENEPWTPPDVPQLAPTATEQRGGWARENALTLSEWEGAGGDSARRVERLLRLLGEPRGRDAYLRASRRAGHGSCCPLLRGGAMIFRVLLYMFLMLGLAIRERVVRIR